MNSVIAILQPNQIYRVRFTSLDPTQILEGVGRYMPGAASLDLKAKFEWDPGHPNGTSLLDPADIVEVWTTDQGVHFPRPLPVEQKVFSADLDVDDEIQMAEERLRDIARGAEHDDA